MDDDFPIHIRLLAERDDSISEFEVWQGLANLYSRLSHWKDAEICLEKARALKQYSTTILHTESLMHEGCGQPRNAIFAYCDALVLDMEYVPCKVLVGALLLKMGKKYLPVARSFLLDALRLEPTNRMVWYYMGIVHRDGGRLVNACDCFVATPMLEESDPIESFRTIE